MKIPIAFRKIQVDGKQVAPAMQADPYEVMREAERAWIRAVRALGRALDTPRESKARELLERRRFERDFARSLFDAHMARVSK